MRLIVICVSKMAAAPVAEQDNTQQTYTQHIPHRIVTITNYTHALCTHNHAILYLYAQFILYHILYISPFPHVSVCT